MDSFDTLVDIIAKLRTPDGCPWDRAQTHLSVKNNLLEESYEVVEALDAEDMGKLCEELGDLLGGSLQAESPIHDDPSRPGARFTVMLPLDGSAPGEDEERRGRDDG